jgi:hypothetical protein
MNRVFTFGCSFTTFRWPTWADILVHHFESNGLKGINWGKHASSNQYSFIKFMEMNAKFHFNKDDLIIFCWTSICREDRYISDKGWETTGNVLTQNVYPKEFNEKWVDPVHYYFRDCAMISSVKMILDSIGCNYHFFSMNKLEEDENEANKLTHHTNKIIEYYGDNMKMHSMSMMDYMKLNSERVGPSVYYGENKQIYVEGHPTPKEHFSYLNEFILSKYNIGLHPKTIDFVNEWIEKIDLSGNPIDMLGLNWDPYKKNLGLVEVIKI